MRRAVVISLLIWFSPAILSAPAAAAAPAHDDFADAAEVGSLPFRLDVDTAGATDEAFEDSLEAGCREHPGMWARFTPEATTTVVAVIDGPQRSAVALYEGADESSLRLIYCMRSLDGRPGSSDGNLHTLEAGQTYHLRLSTAEDEPAEGRYDLLLDIAVGIAGRVRNAAGDPLGDTLVWAYDGDRRRMAAACSRDDGRYRVSGLPPDTYRLEFTKRGCGSGDPGAREWYEDETTYASATPVKVGRDGDTAGIDVEFGQEPEPDPTDPPATTTPTTTPTATRTEEPTDRPDDEATEEPTASPTAPAASETPAVSPSPVARRARGGPALLGGLIVFLSGAAVTGALVLRRRLRRAGSSRD